MAGQGSKQKVPYPISPFLIPSFLLNEFAQLLARWILRHQKNIQLTCTTGRDVIFLWWKDLIAIFKNSICCEWIISSLNLSIYNFDLVFFLCCILAHFKLLEGQK